MRLIILYFTTIREFWNPINDDSEAYGTRKISYKDLTLMTLFEFSLVSKKQNHGNKV